MRISVITSCTGTKSIEHPRQLTMDDFRRGRAHVSRRSAGLPRVAAEELYAGQHHVRLMRGVRALREAGATVDVSIVSAGYGVVAGARMLAPYEATFIGMGRVAAAGWARELKIAEEIRDALARRVDGALVLLGDDYLAACDYLVGTTRPIAVVCGAGAARRLPGNCARFVLSTADATRLHVGLVAMKGEVGRRVLEWLAVDKRRPFARIGEAFT